MSANLSEHFGAYTREDDQPIEKAHVSQEEREGQIFIGWVVAAVALVYGLALFVRLA